MRLLLAKCILLGRFSLRYGLIGCSGLTHFKTHSRERENGTVWLSKQAENLSFFLWIQDSDLEFFTYRKVLHQALIVNWMKKNSTRSATLISDTAPQIHDINLGVRDVRRFERELTGKVIVWEAMWSDASSWALDYSKIRNIVLVFWHKWCLFTWSCLHTCRKEIVLLGCLQQDRKGHRKTPEEVLKLKPAMFKNCVRTHHQWWYPPMMNI